MKLNLTFVESHNRFCAIKNQEFPPISHNCKKKYCCEGGLGIVNSPYQRKEEWDQRLLSYKTKGNHM